MEQRGKLLILALILTVLGYVSYKTLLSKPEGPVDLASCPNGTMPCPNICLKGDAPGWTSMRVAGHPDTDVWMKFVNADGERVAYNQHHVGHVIQLVGGKNVDTGVCPVCRGKTLVCK